MEEEQEAQTGKALETTEAPESGRENIQRQNGQRRLLSGSRCFSCCKFLQCRDCLYFDGVVEAQGYAYCIIAYGGSIMSNIYLTTSLQTLAARAAGPDGKVYGVQASSLVALIATVASLIGAFFLPIIGAVVDYTHHRRDVAIFACLWLTSIQAAQIHTINNTWFFMAMLQAIGLFLSFVFGLCLDSYLPSIGAKAGEERMTTYTSKFARLLYAAMIFFTLLIFLISQTANFDSIETAMVSQFIVTGWFMTFCAIGWKILPDVKPYHELPPGRSLATIGFIQNWKTLKHINRFHGRTLRWFFLAVAFADSGVRAQNVVIGTYMITVLKMEGTQVALFSLLVLFFSALGSVVSQWVTRKANPIKSWKLNMIAWIATILVSGVLLKEPQGKFFIYVPYSILMGISIGWFYPTVDLIFSLSVPRGQDSEFTGFFCYSRTILNWFPLVIFTTMNQRGIDLRFGIMSTSSFFVVALILLQFMSPWESVLESAGRYSVIPPDDDEVPDDTKENLEEPEKKGPVFVVNESKDKESDVKNAEGLDAYLKEDSKREKSDQARKKSLEKSSDSTGDWA